MAVSPAEEILRTLTYNYTATTGSATYTPTTGIIVGPSNKGFLNRKITSSFDINCNSYKKNITSNGHNTLTFKTGSNSTTRTLSINLKMTITPSNLVLANETFSFINLSPGKYYTLTFDVDGIATIGPTQPRLYNMTLVLGSTSYTYDNVFSPIATCSDIFAATGLEQDDTPEIPSEVVYAANNTNTQIITNIDHTYEFEFFIIDKPSQKYIDKQAVRYADLKKDTWRSSSI